MAAMPGRYALERSAGAKERRLIQSGGDKLKCDWQTRVGETAGQRDRRMTRHVKRAGISLQFGNELRLLA